MSRQPSQSREDLIRALNEVMTGEPRRRFRSRNTTKPLRRSNVTTPFRLLELLTDHAVSHLSANAWNILCVAAVRQIVLDPVSMNPRIKVNWDIAPRAPASLKEFCRTTGLNKSSIVDAIREAMEIGILWREHRTGRNGQTIASRYAVIWSQARKWAQRRGKKNQDT